MADLLRCTVAHWQGNDFVAAGTILPAGHANVIPDFFEDFDPGAAVATMPPPEPVEAPPVVDENTAAEEAAAGELADPATLTGEQATEELRAARERGVEVPAYSELNVDELRALVAEVRAREAEAPVG